MAKRKRAHKGQAKRKVGEVRAGAAAPLEPRCVHGVALSQDRCAACAPGHYKRRDLRAEK
jgi:hypothetical protein